MWFCFNDGFVSVVKDNKSKDKLLIRSRTKKDLENIVGDKYTIIETPKRDYRFRISLDTKTWNEIVSNRIQNIDYHNFKNSVEDDSLHDLYSNFWFLHWNYQSANDSLSKKRYWHNL